MTAHALQESDTRARRVGDALRLVNTKDMPRADWLAWRRKGIGASEAAAAIGLSPYTSPYELWRLKTGRDADLDLSDNERVQWGVRLEDAVAQQYAEETGRKIERVQAILQSPTHPFMLCNLDRRAVGERRVVEIKTAGEWAARGEEWGESGTDAVPMTYLSQVMHQLAVTGDPIADLAVLIGGQEFRYYTIKRDEDLIASMIEREAAFWKYVVDDTPPPPIDVDDVLRAFPKSIERPIAATPSIVDAVDELVDVRTKRKELEEREDELKFSICEYMGEFDTLTFNDTPLITWRSIKQRETFDGKRHKKDHPDCHALYVGLSAPSRQFLVKDDAGAK